MPKLQIKENILPPLWLIFLFCLILFFWLLFALKEIVVMLFMGYCIAYLVDPLLAYLEKRKISRSIGFILICGISAIVFFLLVFTAIPTLVREYDKLSDNFPEYLQLAKERGSPLLDKVESFLPKQAGDASLADQLLHWLPAVNKDSIGKVLAAIGGTLLQGYSLTLTLLNFLLLPFFAYYLAVDLHSFHEWVLKSFPFQKRKKIAAISKEIDSYVSAFVRGQITVGCVLFLLYCIGLGMIGVELWFLLAIISGFGAIIPYMGFLVGIVLSSIMALATFGDLIHLLQVVGVFLVVQFLESWLITPKIIGEKVGLSPLVIIVAIFAGGHLFGLLGVFLAVPGAAVCRVLTKHLHAWFVEAAT